MIVRWLRAILLLALCSPSAYASQTVRIGMTQGLTGRYADICAMQVWGYRLWEREVNARGGLLGHLVEVVILDDQGDGRLAAALYEKLISGEKVDLVFGPYSSPITEAILPVTERHGFPVLVGGRVLRRTVAKGFRDGFRRVHPGQQVQGRVPGNADSGPLQQVGHTLVKNNLQVISGSLNLQAHHIADAVGREIYKESQNRIVTMAFIHEQLYQSADLAHVNFGTYIHQLVRNLFVSYGIERSRVDLVLETQDTTLVVDTAIPCGLIVNELVSNALRHAFRGRQHGCVTVRFRESGPRKYDLEVSDDGVGLPSDFDINNTKSMGLKLVLVLVEQLRGSLEIQREGGTAFNISFEEYLEAGTELH